MTQNQEIVKREIKFRAWNPYMKIFEKPCDWEIDKDNEGVYGEVDDYVNDENVRIELQQFIGLKDKNRKEIYEGDILTYGDKEDGIVIKIVWNDLDDNGFEIIRQSDERVIHDIRIYRFDEQSEIIGNIYENPELLNGDTNE